MVLAQASGYAQVGIDDCGTGDGQLVGWACYALNPVRASEFQRELEALVGDSDIGYFHGRDFTLDQEAIYEKFLSLIAEHMRRSLGGLAQVELISTDFYERNREIAVDVALKALNLAAPQKGEAKRRQQLARGFAHLVWLAKNAPHLRFSPPVDEMTVHLARADSYGLLGRQLSVFGVEEAQDQWLKKMYNGFRRTECNNQGPFLRELHVNEPADSPMIQAADVIANFALACIRESLDPVSVSDRTRTRASLLRKAFNDDSIFRQDNHGPVSIVGGKFVCASDVQISCSLYSY